MDQPELSFSQPKEVVCLQLSPEQAKQLAPLAIEGARNGQNILFISTIVPFWSSSESATPWEFQVVRIRAKAGQKVIRLIREAATNPESSQPFVSSSSLRAREANCRTSRINELKQP